MENMSQNKHLLEEERQLVWWLTLDAEAGELLGVQGQLELQSESLFQERGRVIFRKF